MINTGCIDADVCVIGGGPAGAATAARLAALGHAVVVLEAQPFPRVQFGASLPPGIWPLFDRLGVRDAIEAGGFVCFNDLLVSWEGPPKRRHRAGEPGRHVDRARLDNVLLDFARSSGATVIQPARADRPARANGQWAIAVRGHAAVTTVFAGIVVDASGSRRIGLGTRRRMSAPTLALYSTWHLPRSAKMEGCVEAGWSEWMWCAPLGPDAAVAAVFVEPRSVSGFSGDQVAARYRQLIAGSVLVGRQLGGAAHGPVLACDASSWAATPAAGPDFVRVGDANITLDPLSSQGVQSAMLSALQAAAVINTMIRHPERAAAAVEFYQLRQTESLQRHRAAAGEQYRRMLARYDHPFWRDRAAIFEQNDPLQSPRAMISADCRVQLSNLASIRDTPVAIGDLIEVRPALHHPEMRRPAAFFEGMEIAPLLERLRATTRVSAAVDDWAKSHQPKKCWALMQWLWQHNIILRCHNEGAGEVYIPDREHYD